MKVVLDTNVFISGIIFPKSKAGKIIKEWQKNSIEIVTSYELLAEIRKVLKYPKIIKKTKWDYKKIDEFIEYLNFFTTIVDISTSKFYFEKDPNDNHIINTYLVARCDYLITGDKAIFSLKNENVNIITISEFLENYFLF